MKTIITISTPPRRNWMTAARELVDRGLRESIDRRFREVARSRRRVTRASEEAVDRYFADLRRRATSGTPKEKRTRRKLSALFHELYGRNPTAADLREDFTGSPADRYSIHHEPHMPAGDYAQLGKLDALHVKPISGGQVMTISFPKADRPLVVSDETARQIYFVGGDQDVREALQSFDARANAAGLLELGEARRIDYTQRKEQVPDPDVDRWRHEFGEETGIRPTVLFDPRHKRLLLEGGEYKIRPEGIVN